MGTYNQEGYVKILEKFKEYKCPLCDSPIEIDFNYKLERDSIDYKCLNCRSDGKIISISGTFLATDNFPKIMVGGTLNYKAKMLIKESKKESPEITSFDFR